MQSNTTEGGKATANRVSSTMSASVIITLLSQHKCQDITDQLDLDKCGDAPVSGGGSGDIYQGSLSGGEQVAIKCAQLHLRQDDTTGHKVLKHVARELYMWSRLKHDNVLPLLGLAQFQGQMAMVSPWMKSGTLLEYIERNPDTDHYRLCADISEGVAYLHQSDVIHGDIKSGNVLISDEGVAKLADFGCTELKMITLNFTTTSSTSMFSTRWAAPEILKGSVEQSMMVDVYALGMQTLLEVVTGAVPFPDKQDMAVYHTVVSKRLMPERPDEFPSFDENEADRLWGVMMKSWARGPSSRPTATAVRDLLKAIKLPRICPRYSDTTKHYTLGEHKYKTYRSGAISPPVSNELRAQHHIIDSSNLSLYPRASLVGDVASAPPAPPTVGRTRITRRIRRRLHLTSSTHGYGLWDAGTLHGISDSGESD